MKIYPSILVQAEANGQPLGGYRVWFLAKHWHKASGYIPSKKFKEYLKELGIAKSSYHRWIKEAYDLGLFQQVGKLIKLAGWTSASKLAGCKKLDNPVTIEIDKFINAGWKDFVWACFVKNHEGIIARATLQELSGGVPERTQRYRERRAGVRNHANYASFGKVKDHPEQAYSVYGEQGYYQQAGEIRRRLPNSRTVPECIQQAKKGRKKKVNKALAELFSSDATSSSGRVYRLYSDSYKQTKRIKQQDRKQDDRNKPDQIFERTKQGVYYAISL
jgi:hypothetical protein